MISDNATDAQPAETPIIPFGLKTSGSAKKIAAAVAEIARVVNTSATDDTGGARVRIEDAITVPTARRAPHPNVIFVAWKVPIRGEPELWLWLAGANAWKIKHKFVQEAVQHKLPITGRIT